MSLILKFALKLKGARAHCAAEHTQQPPLFLSPPPQFFTPRRRLLKRFNTKLKRRDNRIVDRLFVPDEFTQEVFKGRSLLRFRRGHVHVCRGSGGRRKNSTPVFTEEYNSETCSASFASMSSTGTYSGTTWQSSSKKCCSSSSSSTEVLLLLFLLFVFVLLLLLCATFFRRLFLKCGF